MHRLLKLTNSMLTDLRWQQEAFEEWVHVQWWVMSVQKFVVVANDEGIEAERPEWLSQKDGTRLTAWQFMEDVMKLLAEVAGGRNENTLGIGTFDHYAGIFVRVGHIETHPFIQECMGALPDDVKSLAGFMRHSVSPWAHSFAQPIEVIQILGRLPQSTRRVFA